MGFGFEIILGLMERFNSWERIFIWVYFVFNSINIKIKEKTNLRRQEYMVHVDIYVFETVKIIIG